MMSQSDTCWLSRGQRCSVVIRRTVMMSQSDTCWLSRGDFLAAASHQPTAVVSVLVSTLQPRPRVVPLQIR